MAKDIYSDKSIEELENLRSKKLEEYTSTRTDMNDLTELFQAHTHDPESVVEQIRNNVAQQNLLQSAIASLTALITARRVS